MILNSAKDPANIAADIAVDISVEAYSGICRDIRNQPKWRLDSDTDCDYYDGAQTSVEVIQRLKDAGIPPQDSNLIKPTINAVLGIEARSRTDYKITSDDEQQAELAEGLSAKIKEVEAESRADRAMSDAYSSMIRAGVGWVEVSREFDPLRYPYRVREIHRNEIWWDWTSKEPDLSDARYLRRDKWVDRAQAVRIFPEQQGLIDNSWSGWNNLDVYEGGDTRMARAYEVEQAWGQTWGHGQEDYLNRNSSMVRLSELWYRYFESAYVLALPDGKVIEYREDNPYHEAALSGGLVHVQKSLLSRMRVAIWLGPHKLMDVPSPLPHRDFPYVPFWCFRKDRSRTPYGLVRDMRGPQDQILDLDILLYEVLNSVKVEVDNDALDLSQNTYQEVAHNISSLRSMTVLNAQRRNAGGFKVTREHALAAQVFQLVEERKHRIEAVSGVYRAMLGASTQAASGVAINNLVEQGSTVLAEPNDNFRYARRLVGQQLLAFIKYDLLGKQMTMAVRQGNKQKTVYFNREVMTHSGPMIENDIETAQVRVVLEDIPTTPSFRAQQLQAFTQIAQAAPPAYQAVLYPAMLELSDVPNRHELAEQLRKVGGVGGPNEQTQQMQQQFQAQLEQAGQIVQGLQAELGKAQQALGEKSAKLDLKARDLDIKEKKVDIDARLKAEQIASTEASNAQKQHEGIMQ